MASIGEYGNGRKRILIVGGDGKRRTIRLGKATMKQAEAFKVKVEQLVSASITGVMEDETARWIAGLDDKTHAKLAAVDLVKARAVTREMADAVIAACPDSEWTLLFALSRFGGLRCPSEHLSLRWGDVDFEKNRIFVHSPKTEARRAASAASFRCSPSCAVTCSTCSSRPRQALSTSSPATAAGIRTCARSCSGSSSGLA